MERLRKIGRFLFKTSIVLSIVLLLFELSYRYYLIDFYKSELKGLNRSEDLKQNKPRTMLILGDSFSADPRGYVSMLRDSLPNWNVINASVPGISSRQMRLYFGDRIDEFNPDLVVFQLYVGNDFQDYSHTRNWSKLSFSRNCFWAVSDRLMSLAYVNFRLGGSFATWKGTDGNPKLDTVFSKPKYNYREKMYANADPKSLQKAIDISDERKGTYGRMKADLKEMLELHKGHSLIVVVPHSAQTSEKRKNELKKIGYNLSDDLDSGEFGFYESLRKDFANKHVKVCSPLSEFRKAPDSLYYANDPHLTVYGQKKLGEFILNQLHDW